MLWYLSKIAVDGIIVLSCYAQFNNRFLLILKVFLLICFSRVCSKLRSKAMGGWSRKCLTAGMKQDWWWDSAFLPQTSSFPDAPNNWRKDSSEKMALPPSSAGQSLYLWQNITLLLIIFLDRSSFFHAFWTKHKHSSAGWKSMCIVGFNNWLTLLWQQ